MLRAPLDNVQSLRPLLLGIAVASAAALAVALLGEYVFGIVPCQLCLFARIPYAATAAFAIAGLTLGAAQHWPRLLAITCAVAFAGGTALALYQVGVEQHWVAAPASCRGEIPGASALSALVEGQVRPKLRPCDEDVWRLFGLSLAGWNAIASLVLCLGTLGTTANFWGGRKNT